ncbi:FAD-dependent monooxygenase [Nakamurella sp.]|uniref:FAD-dependent monooxygenase n=1 Tax=Nakamurella sp. TaxID=1869182 RepID=UPI0037833831
MKVGIVGGGIGGLATAVGLQRTGVDVTVVERSERPAVSGSGISLFGNGLAALAALGMGDAAREIGAVAGELGVTTPAGQRRPDGRWLVRLPRAATETVAVVHRADLQRILLAALAPGTVRTGRAVRGVSADGRSVEVDDTIETFDVVVAADGIRSRIRAGRPGDPGVRYAGYVAWRGVTDRPVDVSSGSGETVGRGLRFGIAPLADGRVYWFAVVSQPRDAPVPDGPAIVARQFAGWHPPIRELIESTPPESIHGLPIEELAGRLPTYRRGRCVLLGDAAHAMTPNLGQGGNQALEDAATLVALLSRPAGPAGIDAALAEYDRLRRPRTQRIARQAGILGRVLQAHGPVVSRLRDAGLRLTPPGAAARSALAVQRWAPPAPARPVVNGGAR